MSHVWGKVHPTYGKSNYLRIEDVQYADNEDSDSDDDSYLSDSSDSEDEDSEEESETSDAAST